MASAVVTATAAVLLLFVVVAEGYKDGKWAGSKHHNYGMDDCGRNRTCRELSRECKKLMFTSMVDNYVDAGDDEIVTSMDKMAAMMEMFMEHKKNMTDCANETGIQLPNLYGTGSSNTIKNRMAKPVDGVRGGRFGRPTSGGKWQNGNFGVSEEDAIELRKCLLNKKMMLNPDDSLNREILKAQISSSYSFQAGLQAAVEEAVDTCPEPQDYNIHELNKCINKACIDNIQLDDEEFPQDIKEGMFGLGNRRGTYRPQWHSAPQT